MKVPIYFDYAATTPIDPRVIAKMSDALHSNFGNPSSVHTFGKAAKDEVENARYQIANLIHAEPSEIIWTSGATEANNLALKGAAENYKGKGRHIITLKTEHPSVLDCCQQLEKNGFTITYLTPEKTGLLDLDRFIMSLREDTIIVSIMHVNNEIGVVQDIQKIAKITAERGILFHMDAAQSAGKIPIDVSKTPIDLISFSAHKLYGPKGVGALYLRRRPRVRVAPQMHGGGQEQGMRSGTLPTHQIIGMGTAFDIAKQEMAAEDEKMQALRKQFLAGIKGCKNIHVNCEQNAIPTILSLRFENKTAEELMHQLPEFSLSAGSACLSKGSTGSSVLRALGQSDLEVKSTVRLSFGRFTTSTQVDFLVAQLLRR